ncbi:MAG: transporter [Pirellulales bacterium]
MNIPTGSAAFTSNSLEPGVNWLYGWDVNDFLSMAGSTQGNRRIDNSGEAYLEIAQSWTVGYTLTERLHAYTEWFALMPNGADTALTEHYFDGGFTFLLNDNWQFDIRAGVGLNSAAQDYFIGTGFAMRFY